MLKFHVDYLDTLYFIIWFIQGPFPRLIIKASSEGDCPIPVTEAL